MNEDFKSQEHNQENALRITVPYNLKKVLAGIMLAAVPVFIACEKDPVKPENKKHNVELVYGKDYTTQWQNISLDTLNKYNKDETVDSIFMILEKTNQFATLSATPFKNIIVPELRKRHNVNPNKVFGKGDLKLSSVVLDQHQEIVRFFADTLRYNVR